MNILQLSQQAADMQNSGDFAGAMAIYKRLLPKDKKNPDLLIRTAITAMSLGNEAEAKAYAQKAVKAPEVTGVAHNILGAVALHENNLTSALRHFEKAVQHLPNDVHALLNLSHVLGEFNRAQDALPHMEHALELAPNFSKTHYFTGEIHKSLGHFDQAAEYFRNVTRLDPNDGSAWKALAGIGATTIGPDTDQMEEVAQNLTGNPSEQARVLFALFLTYEKTKDFKQAYKYLESGNKAFTAAINYDIEDDLAYMRAISETFTPDLFDRFKEFGNKSSRPIFIVGMPRSGTTLIEQILAGHSQISAGGEMTFLENAINTFGARSGLKYPQTCLHWKKKDIRQIADAYLTATKNMGNDRPYMTDKLPDNFLLLGMVNLAFPNARIIHSCRNPVECCLANFRIMFATGHYYSYAQETLVKYYKAYQELMSHWHKVMGDQILDIDYETLAANPEQEAKRILEFCNLDWEPDCLDIKKVDRPVLTASAAQVREGIHTRFLSRTDNYTPYIKTLIDGFSDA